LGDGSDPTAVYLAYGMKELTRFDR